MTAQAEDTEKVPWWRIVLIGRKPRRTLLRILVLVAVCLVTFKFVLLLVRVQGPSMQPTYREGQVHVINRLAYVFHEPRRGDVIAIKMTGVHEMLLKRVVGLPGETVAFHHGRLLIDGQVLPEPYVKFPCDWEKEPVAVGANQYYVVGDNRSMSVQDHDHGRAKREGIVGKLLL